MKENAAKKVALLPRPVLLLEINEVPWRLLDRYLGHPELPALTRFFEAAQTRTTLSQDQGELSPWITWPSFHRGIPNTEHGIQFLGQEPASFKGQPIWDVYRERGHAIGIFGSMQSWPPTDPGPGGFYIPDTFARDERCIPARIEPFQRFNLRQTGANGRVIDSKSLYDPSNLRFVLKLPGLGLRPRTAAAVLHQLVGERLDRKRLARRPIFQGILSWEIFRGLYDPASPPAFATFFTNQVAGVMHRYWDHIFPEDFKDVKGAPGFDKSDPQAHRDTMLFALRSVDRILEDALAYCKRNPELIVIFASSMGQGPKVWKRREGYTLSISGLARLLAACGLGAADFEELLAMVPQICARIPDPSHRSKVRKTLESATSLSGEKLFAVDEREDRASITVITPVKRADIECGRFKMGGLELDWPSGGIEVHAVEPGTGYHIPEGSMAVYGRGITPDPGRAPMPATQAKDFILSLSGVS
jgi:hypothetical protein